MCKYVLKVWRVEGKNWGEGVREKVLRRRNRDIDMASGDTMHPPCFYYSN